MGDRITRREFIDGFAVSLAATLLPAGLRAQNTAGPYPPAATGWRGSTPADLAAAHLVRDGKHYSLDGLAVEENYDLAVIGAGISGLAAAHYFRAAHPTARILVLDNHDEFGGHARRNEFSVDGRLLIGYGGSEAIQSPRALWSDGARQLLTDIGVDLRQFDTAFNRTLYPGLGLSRGIFFGREAFGVDRLVRGDPMRLAADEIPQQLLNARSPADCIADYPLPAADRQRLLELYTERRDVMPGLSVHEKSALLAHISYRDFIKKYWGLDDLAANTLQGRSNDFFGIGIDALAALDTMEAGFPGFQGLGLKPSAESRAVMDEPYIYHFPDGNASLARLLVRQLIPGVAPGTTMSDIVTAKFDYARLDQEQSPTRVRLSSTVVRLHNSAGHVEVGYVRAGRLHRVQCGRAIFAGYGTMLPYICTDLDARQREALAAEVRSPLVYVNVAVRNWQPWVKLGVHEISNPMGFYSQLKLDYPVSLGSYRCPVTPAEPMLVHLVRAPTMPESGLDMRGAYRAARAQLYAMSFSDFEDHLRDELTRALGPGGFDAGRDIAAITVNRWGHGYAYGFNSLYDRHQQPPLNQIARRRVGRLAIAGSDAAWDAYAHAAIDEARRAVNELNRL
jgi:spermidine dehydrogenase